MKKPKKYLSVKLLKPLILKQLVSKPRDYQKSNLVIVSTCYKNLYIIHLLSPILINECEELERPLSSKKSSF